MLLGVISLASLSTFQANSNPIWDTPANTQNYCMADAYFLTGGKGLKNNLGAALNCTANDVEITTVTVNLVNGNGPDSEGNFTCKNGDPIAVTADLKVRTNANERWDTTFFLPLNTESPQVIQQDDKACSIVIPKPEYATDPDSGVLVAQDLDEDACGDIAKGPLVNDEYTLMNATFTMLCDGGDDTQVDFVYCAAWDNQERNNCEATGSNPGQEPNTTSKCNCGDIPLNIFIQPDPPTVTKTVSGSPSDEPQGTYSYTLKVETNSPEADLSVTALSDYIWSLTDDDNTLYEANLITGTIVPTGSKFTLLVDDAGYDCDEVSLPKVLNAANLAFECDFVVQIDDDDLPDNQSDELYRDVIKVIAEDNNTDNIGQCIVPLTTDTLVDGTCSNEIVVAIQDVVPSITIDKFAIAGPNYQCISGSVDSDGKCSGVVYIDEPGGDVTYKLIITNNSTVDPLTITSLTDLVIGDGTIDLLANFTGNTCDDSLPIHLAIKDATGDSFSCQFVRDVSGLLGTTMNTATVNAVEKTGHSEGNMPTHNINASVTMIDVPPMVTLLKEVKASGEPDTSFSATTEVDEPGGDVVYRFTVTNTSPAQESIDLLSLTDAVLGGSRVTQGDTDCKFDGSITISYGAGNAYSCTIAASVTGDPSNNLVNTAYVTITDGESNLNSNNSTATVTFKNIPADGELTVKLSATAFITIKNTSSFEAIKLTQLKLLGSDITTADYTYFNVINGGYGGDFNHDGETYSSCDQPTPTFYVEIAANSSYRCAFTVELLADGNGTTDFNVLKAAGASETIKIVVEDFDGGAVDDESIQAVVHLTPNL